MACTALSANRINNYMKLLGNRFGLAGTSIAPVRVTSMEVLSLAVVVLVGAEIC